jgi:hypothetical protein
MLTEIEPSLCGFGTDGVSGRIGRDGRALAAARCFAQSGMKLLADLDRADAVALANDEPITIED